ncbi:hypothetical protein Agub_g6962, partial [Astrephomene gubernaculifera]
SCCLAWREQQVRAHPNSWRPLRSTGSSASQQRQPPLQRSRSASVGDPGLAAAAAAAAMGGVSGGGPGGGSQGLQQRSSYSGVGGLAGMAAGRFGAGGGITGGGLLSGPGALAATSGAAAAVSTGPTRNPSPGRLPGSASAASAAAAGTTSAAGGSGSGSGSGGAPSMGRLRASLAAMLHFMATLEQWVATQLVHDAWVQLEQALAASRSLDDVCAAHTAYTVTLLRRCFRYSGEEGSRHTGVALRKCLDACLRFAAAMSGLSSG